jgi:hypothetical protein
MIHIIDAELKKMLVTRHWQERLSKIVEVMK